MEGMNQAAPLLDSMTPKERREWENSNCLGGLRNPRFAQEKLPHLRQAGQKLHDFLDEYINLQPDTFIEDMLSPKAATMAQSVEKAVTEFMAQKLGCSPRRGKVGKMRPEIAAAIGQLSGDPDVEVPRWMDEGAPLGISAPIVPCGVFPPIQPKHVVEEAHKY